MKRKFLLICLIVVFCVSLTLAACKSSTYTATFNTNGGTFGNVTVDGNQVTPLRTADGNSQVSVPKDATLNVEEPAREGYVFANWYTNEDLSGNPVTFPTLLAGDTTFYAKWVKGGVPATEYTVNFVTNGGSAVESMFTSVISSQPQTTRSGYIFAGWFDNVQLQGEPVNFPYAVTDNVTLYAKWVSESAKGYTLTLNPMGGDRLQPLTNKTVVELSDLPTATYVDRIFVGWYLDEACTKPVKFPYTLTDDTTFYAKWSSADETVYTLTFHDVRGLSFGVTVNGVTTALKTDKADPYINVMLDDKVVVGNPTKANATFDGWYRYSTKADKQSFPLQILGNTALYAKWKINETPNAADSAKLAQLLTKNTTANFEYGYGKLIQNSIGAIQDDTFSVISVADRNIGEVGYYYDGEGWKAPYWLAWAFYRGEVGATYMTYMTSDEGEYNYGNFWYEAAPVEDLEEVFNMVYLDKLSQLDTSKFFVYDGIWYATAEYANEAGKLILGNASGDPTKFTPAYSSFAIAFNSDGDIAEISANSVVAARTEIDNGWTETYYYYTHTVRILNRDNVKLPDEDQFYHDNDRPSGLYPSLNPNDEMRNNVAGDGNTYTREQLASALSSLNSFTSYYTLAGNTFDGLQYTPVTIETNGNVGKITTDPNYTYTVGETVITPISPSNVMYYLYKPESKAFFLIVMNNAGTTVQSILCDQYSYRNNYDYNQYLNNQAISYNCKYPAVSFKYMDASKFNFNTSEGYFEYSDKSTITEAGKALFGDMDYVYPEASETESYTFLRIYMNGGKVVKVLAATQLALFGESYEFFIKEIVITSTDSVTVTLPDGAAAKCVAPGEAKVGGSTADLQDALATTRQQNYKYTDQFVYDDDDDLGGIYGSKSDVYIHYNGITKSNENLYLYFKDGKLYYQQNGRAGAEFTLASVGYDVEKANEWLLWAQPMANLLDASWFYEGASADSTKIFYGNASAMAELSRYIARFSGSEWFLEGDANSSFSDSYRWTVELDFVSLTLSNGRLDTLYYSGVIHVVGMGGQHTKPFVGQAKFAYDVSALQLPVTDTNDADFPALQQYLGSNYVFSVDDDGKLHYEEIEGATEYVVTVYSESNKTQVLATVTVNADGYDLKSIEGLNIDATDKYFYLSIRAKGNGTTLLDGPESIQIRISLSTSPKLPIPQASIDSTGVLTIANMPENARGFHYVINNENTQLTQGNVATGNTLDLKSISQLAPNVTYTVTVYLRGLEGQLRDSDTVTLIYTPARTDGVSYMQGLFNALNYGQSFEASFNSSASPRGHYFEGQRDPAELMNVGSSWLNNNCKYLLSLKFYYDATINKGNVTFIIYPDGNYSSVNKHAVNYLFKFTKSGDKLVGTYTLTNFGEVRASNKSLTTDLWFTGLNKLNEADFAEHSGAINSWSGLTYDYRGNLQAPVTQLTIAQFSLFEEVLGVDVTYTGLRVVVGYNSDGSLNGECAVILVANYNNDTIVAKVRFNSFGKDLSTWAQWD